MKIITKIIDERETHTQIYIYIYIYIYNKQGQKRTKASCAFKLGFLQLIYETSLNFKRKRIMSQSMLR